MLPSREKFEKGSRLGRKCPFRQLDSKSGVLGQNVTIRAKILKLECQGRIHPQERLLRNGGVTIENKPFRAKILKLEMF